MSGTGTRATSPNVVSTDDQRAVVILERAGYELGRARRSRVHHQHDRIAPFSFPEGTRDAARVGHRFAPCFEVHGAAVRQRTPGDPLGCLSTRSAAVPSEIEHEALHPGSFRVAGVLGGSSATFVAHEGRDAHVARSRRIEHEHGRGTAEASPTVLGLHYTIETQIRRPGDTRATSATVEPLLPANATSVPRRRSADRFDRPLAINWSPGRMSNATARFTRSDRADQGCPLSNRTAMGTG